MINIKDYNDPIPIHAGFLCTSNYLIKSILNLDLKTPFMQMYISLKNIASIIDNDFVDFLNPEFYIKKDFGLFSHVWHNKYPNLLFNHLDPCVENGYKILESSVNNIKNIFNTQDKINFICFADTEYTSLAQHIVVGAVDYIPPDIPAIIQNMSKNIIGDADNLLQIMNKKYPHISCNICIFTKNKELGQQIKNNKKNIVYLPTTYHMNIWEILDDNEQKNAIEEKNSL